MSENGKTTYQIYGRKSYPQPLEFVTAVAVERAEELAGMLAAEEWVEVIAFPETAMIQVIPWGREKGA